MDARAPASSKPAAAARESLSAERRYVSLATAGSIAELSTRTLRRAIAEGSLRAHRVGRRLRIELSDLYRFIEIGRSTAVPHKARRSTV